ncbi:MAG TPA: beta-ketoacyl-[acyl-carrier-protein] synthase family protein [Thermomicrobiales bacterium]|nr:beta-ketoacyl-[acyl-carrier-protein] synthase family protein [Thermomicrobiales bacterium]
MPSRAEQQQQPARVVVTGVGAITAQGTSATAFWENVRDGRVAIREVQRLRMDGYRTRLAGEVQEWALPERDYRRPADFRDPALDFALKAAEEAVAGAGIDLASVPAERIGVVMGTCNAGLISGAKWYRDEMAGREADPDLVLLVPPQALAEAVSGAFGARGPVLSVDTACAAGANAIGYAAELIRTGQADVVLTGGSDALSDVLIAGFNSLESLSPKPAAPYSKDREGLSLGEGSGMLVLAREDLARQVGAPILAEVVGYGLSADGYHPTAPHPEGKGAARAIRAALDAAGVTAEQVQYVNSHGTGTPKNDPAETKATRGGLGPAADNVAVSSTKSMIGHLLGAAGAVEGIITVKALDTQIAPPTANFTEPDPECDLDYVPNVARPMPIDVAISNNFAFGGANACIVLARDGARPEPPPRPDDDRVVVTGLALLTDAGTDAAQVWQAFVDERDCTADEGGVRLGRVDLDPSPHLNPKERRRMDRLGIFAVVASKMALADAGLELDDSNRELVGVIFGTGVGPMESMEKFARPLVEEGPRAANPAVFPNTVYNAAGGQVAMHVGAVGPASTVTAGHAAGASALCYGYDLVATNQADAIVCLAADTLTETVIRAYRELGVLAGDGRRDGFALAEAGVALVLERLGHATARGARIYGEVVGYGITSDACGVGRVDRRGRGLERAMRLALAGAGAEPGDVAAVWANATGQRVVDAAEAAAIARLGVDAPVIAAKRGLGEPMGAGGALSAALALEGWRQGATDRAPAGLILVNSCSLGGTNFSLAIAPYQD